MKRLAPVLIWSLLPLVQTLMATLSEFRGQPSNPNPPAAHRQTLGWSDRIPIREPCKIPIC